MKEMRVKLTLFEETLGTLPSDPEIYEKYIASKAPADANTNDELEGIEDTPKGMTVFARNADREPVIWDYQIKGFFKDACGVLREVETMKSAKLRAYKKKIDGLIFIRERQVPFIFDGEIGTCQRPLRASTPKGERISLASSETVPAGATLEFTIVCWVDSHMPIVKEWLDYGEWRGLGQWRNSGKGRFHWEEINTKKVDA